MSSLDDLSSSPPPPSHLINSDLSDYSASPHRRLEAVLAGLRQTQQIRLPDKVELAVGRNGIGVFAKRDLRAGDFIFGFSGRPLSYEETRTMGEYEGHAIQIGPGLYVDTVPGRYQNHSCAPNTVVFGSKLLALRQIVSGEELTFDYSTTMDEDSWEMTCHCGADQCRGRIRDFKHLPEDIKAKYLRAGMVMDFIARKYR